jgi:hypothetical protein
MRVIPKFQMDWPSAFSFCSAFGMDLATMETKEEQDHLLSLLNDDSISKAPGFALQLLIGGTDIGSESNFYWASSGKPIEYPLNWVEGEPNNYGDKEHCMGLGKWKDSFQVNDVPCTGYQAQFFCELVEEILAVDPRVKP